MRGHPGVNKIAPERATRGTETSKYPEEEEEKSIPQVAASEQGRAQTMGDHGVVGHPQDCGVHSRSGMERPGAEGKTPVGEMHEAVGWYRSTAGHVEPGGKQGGPPPKAKYYLVTDSGQYREGKVKRTPGGE